MEKKVLYVDDEVINLELFKINFRNDFTILVADSAQKGLDILKNENINVIISDLKMPHMNGIDFIERIKHENPEKVCILLTAFMESEVMLRAINEELVYRYIMKPWKKDELREIIESAFKRFENS
ncbi:response regulator [Tenuifilum sp.]|uniref:response regulator n=1 Tax=Tenuifilum sp. TaxID=2760880 RepID=UPI002D011ED5|nr:response regulator [Tenuifilum sp.]HOK85567.1 response regulator [Tenuifilum sp.]HPP89957.1 response regulator [Tenuifilum sp.]HRR11123.1 response regulator [Tenuifilum sp.]HRS44961.1 response regulator [Tenuifilum sp.]